MTGRKRPSVINFFRSIREPSVMREKHKNHTTQEDGAKSADLLESGSAAGNISFLLLYCMVAG